MLQKPALVVVKYIVAAFNKAFRKFTLLNNCFFLHRAQHTKKTSKIVKELLPPLCELNELQQYVCCRVKLNVNVLVRS